MKNFLAALTIGIAVIVSSWLASSAFKYKSKAMETIVVTGLAEKDFGSDLIVWNASYSRKSMDLKVAYAQVKQDENSIRSYLTGKGIDNNSIIFSSVNINKEFSST